MHLTPILRWIQFFMLCFPSRPQGLALLWDNVAWLSNLSEGNKYSELIHIYPPG